MRLLQKIYDGLHGGPDGAPALPPLRDIEPIPVPLRTRMALPADLALVLDERARRKGRGAEWRSSLAELLALSDSEDTAPHRAQLAEELNVDVSDLDEAETAEALHAALIQRLAASDTIAPQDFFK